MILRVSGPWTTIWLKTIIAVLLTALLFGCSGIKLAKDYPETEEDLQSKNLTPAPGKSLVYFYYGRKSSGKGMAVGLDGVSSLVDKDTYLVWEVDPGKHELQVLFEKWLSQETFSTKISTEADRISYYRLQWSIDTSHSGYDKNIYRFVESKEATGRENIMKFSLIAWFRDGEVVFQRDLEATPEEAQTVARESDLETAPVPKTAPEIIPTPEAAPTPEAEPTPETAAASVAPSRDTDETQAISSPGEGLDIPGRYYAVVVGISDYEYLEEIPTAVNDAQAVADVLRDYGFKVNTFFDHKVTRERILDILNLLQELLEPQDKLLLYYAGHGSVDPDGQTAYWLPVDARQESTTQWIIADTITASIKRIPAQQILIVADSVYSGTLDRSGQVGLPNEASRRRYLEKMLEKPARVVMLSGANQPVLMESHDELSLFAQAFVTALTDIERNVFTSEELFLSSIQETVAGQSEQLPALQIIRNSGHQGGDFIFQRQAME